MDKISRETGECKQLNRIHPEAYYDIAELIERTGTLPENFDQWHLADETGWTIAHVAAAHGCLPVDFNQWELADDSLTTVAHVAAEFGNLPAEFDQKNLIDQKAGDTKNLWPAASHSLGPKF